MPTRLQNVATLPPRRRGLAGRRALLFCLLAVLSPHARAAAQEQAPQPAQTSQKTVTLRAPVTFKLKLKRNLNSGRLRIGDYVEFEVAEDVKSLPDGARADDDVVKIVEKGTPAFGQVIDRNHRFTIFKKGAFAVGKLWTTTVDGKRIDLNISRPVSGKEEAEAEQKTVARQKKGGAAARNEEDADMCVDKTLKADKTLPPEQRKKFVPCVRGRIYAGTLVSNLPSALLAVATATALVRVTDKEKATAAVLGVTLADKFVSQPGLSNIINGVDAEMEGGEVFDAETVLGGPRVIRIPKK